MTGSSTVLIAEDSDATRAELARLVRAMDLPVRAVANGAAAIQALSDDHSIRIALIDWNMPIVDGLEVCRYIERSNRFVYTIVVTGRDGESDLACALENGANDFVRKPCSPIELQARIGAAQRMCRVQQALTEAQRLESLGQLAAGIAHEINTPTQFVGDNLTFLEEAWSDLGPLLALCGRAGDAAEEASSGLVAELAKAVEAADLEYLNEEVPRALAQAGEGIGQVGRIVQAMKDCGRLGSHEKAPADLNAAIESTLVISRSEWKYVASLELDLAPDLPRAECCIGDVNQVVLNLVVNAAHAIAEGAETSGGPRETGRITIRTRAEGEAVELTVEDDGPGIPEEVLPRVFERFFTTKAAGKGTGQGLAIARELIEDVHGGAIRCENRVEGGARFVIRLPLVQADRGAA